MGLSKGDIEAPPTRCSIVCNFLRRTAMEPFLCLIMFAQMNRSVTTVNLLKDKACLFELCLNRSVCDDLSQHRDYENRVQSIATNYHMLYIVLNTAPAILITLVLGSWSDHYGRKIPILIASFGLLLEQMGLIFNVISFEASINFALLPAIPAGLSGGLTATLTSGMSYLTDVTDSKNRAVRFAVLDTLIVFGHSLGLAIGGVTFSKLGYLPVFFVSMAADIAAISYLAVMLDEKPKKPPDDDDVKELKEATASLFSIKNITDNVRACTRKREGHIRKEIWLSFAAMASYTFAYMGPMSFAFLFTAKMYGWDDFYYSIVTTASTMGQGLLVILVVPLLSRIFYVQDAMLAIIGILSMAIGTALKGLALEDWEYYIASAIAILAEVAYVGMRTRLSKIVASDEIGKIFSVYSVCDNISNLVGLTAFALIYNSSLTTFPGMPFIISASILIIPLIIYIWIYRRGSMNLHEKLEDDGDIERDLLLIPIK